MNSPIKSMKDLAAAAQKAKLNGGSSGNGTPPHLTLALFESRRRPASPTCRTRAVRRR
nr:hypothetical protein [Cupriavidus sp. TA19]